jgi:hypothetical protein
MEFSEESAFLVAPGFADPIVSLAPRCVPKVRRISLSWDRGGYQDEPWRIDTGEAKKPDSRIAPQPRTQHQMI